MNIELKPIAESKVRQLGGEVFGVVIRGKRGRFAAITEMGFVTWLDEDKGGEYAAYLEGMNSHLKAELEAARAQSGQGAEAVAWSWEYRGLHVTADKAFAEKLMADGFTIRPLVFGDAQPQPAVPEGWQAIIDRIVPDTSPAPDQDLYPAEWSLWADRQRIRRELSLLSTPTTPQADGWVRCDERLPTEEDCWVWIYDSEDSDIFHALWRDLKGDYENGHINLSHWMPTGLKRPQPPQEGA
jgi:hypothetical protein